MASIQLRSVDDPRFTSPRRHRWQDDALCAEVDPEAFFPGKGGSSVDAKMTCVNCDVLLRCLQYTMTSEDANGGGKYRHGISGGLSERERRSLSKLMKKYPSMTLEEGYRAIIGTRSTKGAKKAKLATSQELQAL